MEREKLLKEVAKRYPICPHCVGRLFPNEDGETVYERGKRVMERVGIKEHKECYFCRGIFYRLEEIAKNVPVYNYEFHTFIVGTTLDNELSEREEMLLNSVGVIEGVESIKKHINRELGKVVSRMYGKQYSPDQPHVEIHFHTEDESISIHPRPVYLYGRYRKFHPMPQSKWPCRYCKGKGCKHCDYTGRQWKETVEYYMADILLGLFMGRDTKLHAAGREDIDAKMLGGGRPFVIEIIEPRKRFVPLDFVLREINSHGEGKIEVLCLFPSSKREVRELKESGYRKVYRVRIRCKSLENIENASKLRGIITQQTPTRVSHRRADKVRKRRVYSISWYVEDDHRAVLTIEAEEGLYIKELITGDDGRTSPSLSELIGSPCIVEGLDIMEVKGGRPCGK